MLVYSGFQNLGEALGVRGKIPSPKIFVYGKDPIPHVKLYGNQKIIFHMPGGQGNPTAVVIYDPRNKSSQITQIPRKDQNQLNQMFRVRVNRYK